MTAKKKKNNPSKTVKQKNKQPLLDKVNPTLDISSNDQDVQRRLGNFVGAGEHARQGGRRGIVGQTTKKFKTEKRKSK